MVWYVISFGYILTVKDVEQAHPGSVAAEGSLSKTAHTVGVLGEDGKWSMGQMLS